MEKRNLMSQQEPEGETVKEEFKFNPAEKHLMDTSERLAQINTKLQNNPGAREAAKLRKDRIRLNQEQKKFWKEDDTEQEKANVIKKEDSTKKDNLISEVSSEIKNYFDKKETKVIPINNYTAPEHKIGKEKTSFLKKAMVLVNLFGKKNTEKGGETPIVNTQEDNIVSPNETVVEAEETKKETEPTIEQQEVKDVQEVLDNKIDEKEKQNFIKTGSTVEFSKEDGFEKMTLVDEGGDKEIKKAEKEEVDMSWMDEYAKDEINKFITPTNKEIWEGVKDKTKATILNLYKGAENIISNNSLVAKLGIAYNQFWIDSKEEKSVALKEKFDSYTIERNTLNQSITKMREIANNLNASGNSGAASILLDIKKIEKQEISLANKQGSLQTKLERRENEIKSYVNKRDEVADRMISKYEKNLNPIEEKLRALEGERDEMNLFILGKESELEEQKAKLNYQQEQKEFLIKSLMSAGQSLEKASKNKSVRSIEKIIMEENRKIEKEKSGLKDKQNKINNKIDNANLKAEPHREKREQFIRVKSGRPIDLNLQKRPVIENPKYFEEATSYTRTTPNEENIDQTQTYIDSSSTNRGFESSTWFESTPKIGNLITNFNQFLEANTKQNLKIDSASLLKSLKLSNENKVTIIKFKEMLVLYYKIKKIPQNEYQQLISNYK